MKKLMSLMLIFLLIMSILVLAVGNCQSVSPQSKAREKFFLEKNQFNMPPHYQQIFDQLPSNEEKISFLRHMKFRMRLLRNPLVKE